MSSTDLMRAALNGDLEGVEANLGDIGKQNKGGWTALMYAVEKGHANCIPLLKEEIRMQDNDGWTALMKAAIFGYTDCVRLLLSEARKQTTKEWRVFPPGTTALMVASFNGQVDCILLLEKEIGIQDNEGWTALMHAAYNGKIDCARLLLSEAGKQTTKEWNEYSPDEWDSSDSEEQYGFPPGMTALMIAVRQNCPEMIELLLPYEQGMGDSKGHTAQWYANNGDLGEDDFTSVCELLKNEGTERIHPPSNLGDVLRLQEHLSKLTTENETLKMELADQKAQNIALEKEVTQLRTESHDMKDLQRRLEEVEEEKRILLQNLAAVGGRLTNHPQGIGTPTG
ncbi:Ankyrin repeat protein 3 [Giardia muris]|uniref:Ankyrin repeat protein 3 n=1 Tax=Giardia muris TaxID=5742 RepID=A0A4Z1T3A5_GIAMU|nr:Ankyrin repeat protein 3 [Giardia muris]|eukprot:TNJ27039.1 Ankyrin repeat protein 3 [Giardia muris]